MAKPGFFLREPKATNPTLILLIYKLPGGKNFKYSTGESVHPSQWDKATQRAKTNLRGNPTQLAQNKETNLQLDRYILKITEVLGTLTAAKQQPTIEHLKDEMDREFKKVSKPKTTLLTWIEDWIDNVKFTRETPPKPINPRTVLKYRGTLSILENFVKTKRRGKLDFDGIDMDFYFDFTEFLQTKYNHTPNTIGKHITILKLFMREAVDAGVTNNLTHENRKFAAPKEAVEHIYLTEGELEKLAELDLRHKPSLDRVRDLFLIGCRTALRFSDFTAIRPENIVTPSGGGRALKVNTQKTGQTVIIPLHPTVEAILAKYENHLPRAISNQRTNDYIKEAAQLAGINTPVEVTKTIGGRRVQTTLPKWRLVTTHTARRSGATNMYLAGVPTLAIMKITGHKTESVFMKYINVDEEVNAQILMSHEYFKPKMRVV